MRRPHISFPSTVRGWAILIIGIVLVAGIAGAGIWGWGRHQTYLASPAAAVDKLNGAIASKDAVLFSEVVDCHFLSTCLIKSLIDAPCGLIPNENVNTGLVQQYENDVQMVLLAILKGKELPPVLSRAMVPVIPDNLLQQLIEHPFTLAGGNGILYRAQTTFHHPALDKSLPLRLLLQQINGVWKVTRILNASGLLHAYQDAVDAEILRRKEKTGLTLEEHKKAMTKAIPDAECQGGVTRISGQLPLLILTLHTGETPGPENVDAWGMFFVLTDASGREMARPRITSSAKLLPGSGISDTWSLELDESEYQRLEAAGPLACHAEPEYTILSNGKLYKNSLP